MPGDFKGTVFRKIEWGIKYWPKILQLQFTIFLSLKYLALCVYGEYA